jgi:hypothetical protein
MVQNYNERYLHKFAIQKNNCGNNFTFIFHLFLFTN